MKASVLPAKITRPSSPGVFPRRRLFQLLDHGRHQPIVWITGPPGTGKTTLATSWLEARQMHFLWYRVDEGDSDSASFFYYLGLAAQRANLRKRKPLPFLTPEYLLGIPTFSRRFFENVYDRLMPLAEDSASPFAIVFDNFHEVPQRAQFHEILYAGISRVPTKGMKIIFMSREDPPEAFIRLKANGLMKTIGWDELKLTLDESNEMVRLRGCEEVSFEVLRELHKKTDGWAAGIVLLLEGAGNSGIESVLPKVSASKEIFQYFSREIFDRADPDTQDFLLKTSLFQQMSAKMAQDLTGNHQAQHILSDLNGKNYFTQKLESETAVYRHHPLFHEFLRRLAAEVIDPGELISLQKKAALILEANGQHDDAVELLKRAEAWPDAVLLILKHAPGLARQGRSKTLEGWIGGLPETVLEAEPWLLYWAGACRLLYSPSESRTLFEKAFELFRTQRDTAGIFFSLSGLFDSTTFSAGSYKPYDETLALLDEVLLEFPDFPSFEIQARITANRLSAMALRQPWHPDLEKTEELALSILPEITDQNIRTQILQALAVQYLFSGRTSGPLLDIFHEMIQTPGIPPFLRIFLKVLETVYCSFTAEFEDMRKAVEEGLEIASRTGIHVLDAFLLGHGAHVALYSENLEAAEPFLKKMEMHLDQTSVWTKEFYHHLHGWRSLLKRDFSNALHHEEMSLKFGLQAGVLQTSVPGHLGCAMALHELKRDREATVHLAECYVVARSCRLPFAEFTALLAEAKFAFDKGDDSSGLISLEKAMSIGREKEYFNTYYAWIPAMMAELCQRALGADIEVDYVRRLVRKRNLMPDPPPFDCEKWPWGLKIFTLGRFVIVRDGEAVQFSGKVQKRPLELLKVLISNGGGELSEEYIAECLWPDATGDRAHIAVKTTISRLRHLTGVEGAIRFQEGKVSLDPRYCWVDALAFERILAQFQGRLEEETVCLDAESSKILQIVEKLVGIYSGHYLPADEGQICTISYRERLRSKFSRTITSIGNLLEKRGQWERATEYYLKGIDIDDLSEQLYQRLMVCHQELGRHVDAAETYNRCRKLLSAKLGIEPSERTKAIYKAISGTAGK
ncbi:MAG TPA: BTAD domain-containing putative transcriptional regulator [Syntrophobacteraceae bacterium]|nr:BTAD domain-containing putative transcriptional regulator [Syntrophobacteraceae bacterium]